MEFPRFVYKKGGKYTPVNDTVEWQAAINGGWFDSVLDAEKPIEIKKEIEDDNLPPTREELEQKAKELGIKFHWKTNDKNLTTLIDEALKK